MPLTFASIGETNYIKRITGKDEVRNHLSTLGFIEGEAITLISNQAGNVIISIKQSRIALNKAMASRIHI